MASVAAADVLAAALEADAAARDAATACKRKLKRISGAVDALDALVYSVGTPDLSAELLAAEEQATKKHEELVKLLEQTDGGELLKRPRTEWFEAAGVCEFVRAHDLLHQSLPEMERQTAEARERWEAIASERERLSMLREEV